MTREELETMLASFGDRLDHIDETLSGIIAKGDEPKAEPQEEGDIFAEYFGGMNE